MKKRLTAALMLVWMALFLAQYGDWTEAAVPPLYVLPALSPEAVQGPLAVPDRAWNGPDLIPEIAAQIAASKDGTSGAPEDGTGADTVPEDGTGAAPDTAPEDGTGAVPPDPTAVPAEENVNPLTGLEMSPERTARRPVAVVFNNFRRAQPQLGVSQADILYEVPAEGGITRMLGIYQSVEGVGNLGSIRSARTYVLELALAYDALLVHAGASPAAYQEIPAWGVDNMDGVRGGSDASIFWRDAGRRQSMGYEHSLLTSGQKILDYLARGRCRTERNSVPAQRWLWNAVPENGAAAERVEVLFNDSKLSTFDYDPDSGTYQASQYGRAYTDGSTGERIQARNLLVLRTTVQQIAGDEAGRLRIDTVGEDGGLFFCGGRYVPIRWSRPDRNSPFTYTLEDGTPLALGRGRSYICVVGHLDPLTITPDGNA